MYAKEPEKLNFHLKTNIQKYLIFSSWYNFLFLIFRIFTDILLLKLKTLSFYISTKHEAILTAFNNKTYLL